MPKLRNLQHRLEEFNRWLEQHASKKTTSQKIKQHAKKAPGKVEELIDDVGSLADKAGRLFENVIDEVILQKTPDEKLVRDLKRKGEDLTHHVGQALKDSKGIVGELRKTLTILKDILSKGLSKLSKSFSNILSMPDPHQKQPKFAPAMSHKGPPLHLPNEQKFKAGQRGGSTHVEAHRKILTTKNK
ncbi:MAG: hypothetical protein HYX61_07385 [Gammaproteobacteria bacterium]|jgi:hypothetical protein|nr:hypothetical protein [Gammaproteobacteria bacterium]